MELYDWQRKAIDYFFKKARGRAIFQVPTGAGKSFCAIEIIKKALELNPDIKILIVVPKNVILETTWYKELYDNGINIQDIGVWYGEIKETAKITLTNVQSIEKLDLDKFQFIIFDEIHNMTKRLLKFLKHFDFDYMLGLSATLKRNDHEHINILKEFHYNLYEYTTKEALTDNILNPFDFINIAIVMDTDTYEIYDKLSSEIKNIIRTGGGYEKIMSSDNTALRNKMLMKMNIRKQLYSNYERKIDIAKMLCEQHKEDKVIVFNSFNKQTNAIYWNLMECNLKPCIIHSSIDKDKRQQNIIDYRKDKYNIMLVSKVLDEGYNLPSIDVGIIMAGDRSSKKQIIQRLGRILRKKNRKSVLYQVYCKGTVEEETALKNTEAFRKLCVDYKIGEYNLEGELKWH